MKVLILGFYNKQNAGDDFFAEAFRNLLCDYQLTFTDHVTEKMAHDNDMIIIGGGSFLNQDLDISSKAFEIIKNKPIFYVGIGAETDINLSHMELLKKAKYVFIRSEHKNKIPNNNCMVIPDLVYSLKDKVVLGERQEKSVLIFPNIALIPQHNEPHWKFTAWEHFKNEFAQFLDELVQENYKIRFMAMSRNPALNDNATAHEIINRMQVRSDYVLHPHSYNFCSYANIVSKQSIIISQRFHSTILAQMTSTPYISIGHHQKFQTVNEEGIHLSFFNISKEQLRKSFEVGLKIKPQIEIDLHIFEAVKKIIQGKINAMGSP